MVSRERGTSRKKHMEAIDICSHDGNFLFPMTFSSEIINNIILLFITLPPPYFQSTTFNILTVFFIFLIKNILFFPLTNKKCITPEGF